MPIESADKPNPAFVKAFLPGLVLGLIVGALAGAFIPEMLGAGTSIAAPDMRPTPTVKAGAGDSRAREAEAFTGKAPGTDEKAGGDGEAGPAKNDAAKPDDAAKPGEAPKPGDTKPGEPAPK